MEDMEANDEPEPETTTTEAADQDQDVEMVASPGQADAAADKYSSMTYRELQVWVLLNFLPSYDLTLSISKLTRWSAPLEASQQQVRKLTF